MALMNMKSGVDGVVFERSIESLGEALHEKHRDAAPFAHSVIEDFLPQEVLDRVMSSFPDRPDESQAFNRSQERFKMGFNPDDLEDLYLQTLFHSFNSQPFLRFLEGLTGYTGLLPDPGFTGGGFHETLRGGHLGIHADFNLSKEYRVKRRINVLVYLNEDWDDSYGGHLELWKKDMSECVSEVAPLANRCVIFNTEDDSFHGQPNPLTTPEGVSRRSIAMYYYVASDAILDEFKEHTTLFKARRGTTDKVDYEVKYNHMVEHHVPVIFTRAAHKIGRMMKITH